MQQNLIERLNAARRSVTNMQKQVHECYHILVNQILAGLIEPEDVLFVMENLAQDCHNDDLCYLYAKLDRYISENVASAQNGESFCSLAAEILKS